MALEVTGVKHHWLEILMWDDGLLTEATEFLVRKTPSQKLLKELGPLDNTNKWELLLS